MQRFTEKMNDGRYQTKQDAVVPSREGYIGPAIERLGQVEELMEFLTKQQEQLSKDLESLRMQGKTHSARFRDKMAQKLTNRHILSALRPAFGDR